MLKDEYIVNLCMYLKISCICLNNTVNHFIFDQQLYWIYTEGKSLKLGPGLPIWTMFTMFNITCDITHLNV